MPVKAVDLHVHLPIADWLDGSLGPYREPAERYFRSRIREKSADEIAVEYAQEGVFGILLGWDAETATGRPPLIGSSRSIRMCAFCTATGTTRFLHTLPSTSSSSTAVPGSASPLRRSPSRAGERSSWSLLVG